MADRSEERRALYEAILADPHASHGERLKADERLAELEREDRTFHVDELSPDQLREELESLASAIPGMLTVAEGPEAVRPPAGEEAEVLRRHIAVVQEDRRLAFEERDRVRSVARGAFEELFGEGEPDCGKVIAAWREMREDPPDAEVVPEEIEAGG